MIAHLDADCFYVSAERVRHRCLTGLPVGVLGNQGACVIAKSYEMKAAGVKTGEPIWEAVVKCPDGVYIKRDFHWYEAISRRMFEVVKTRSPTIEYYSIDEFFFDAKTLAPLAKNEEDIHIAARELQEEILDKIGVPVSIGISRSRTLAKLASDACKPYGCKVLINDEEIDRYVESLEVTEITGVAERSRRKLALHGITTVGDFRRADRRLIRKLLTVRGEILWWELHGDPIDPIQTKRPMHKAVARGGSVGKSTGDPARLEGWLVRNCERLVEALVRNQYVCGRLQMALSYKQGGGASARCSLGQQIDCSDVLLPAARQLFEQCWDEGIVVSHMHLIADKLAMFKQRQLSLFEKSSAKLDHIKADINGKIGRFAVRSGTTLQLPDIYADETNDYDICDIHGKTCF
ncbi:MAG: nucleotidyltransferase [Blastopirellula sp.]|nr:MAG: nucleotidyltransferase [Blastopirellula sp.]